MKPKAIKEEFVAELIKPYPGKWVILSADKTKVLRVSSRLTTALAHVQKQGEGRSLLIKVPDAATAAFLY